MPGTGTFLASFLYSKYIHIIAVQHMFLCTSAAQVGVGIGQDTKRLLSDYAIRVTSAVDLRDIIRTVQPDMLMGGASLASLSR